VRCWLPRARLALALGGASHGLALGIVVGCWLGLDIEIFAHLLELWPEKQERR